MKYIFDRVGIDASAGNMLRVPNDDYENFPDPAIHRGGFYYDSEEDRMYYSNGIIWTQVGSGSVTSVNASASGALSVTGGPIVTTGVLNINWTGTSDYLVQGDGTLILKTSIIPVVSPSALTKIDDTNVTLALGGSPASALLQNVSLTLGWNGVLSTTRGGTGLGSLGTANQLLRVNTGATALEYFTPNWTSNTGTVTSIAMSVPPAFTITGSPITTSGTLALGITAGYIIPTTTQVGYWNTISQPNGQITYGNGIGITSNPNLTFDVATYRLSIGVLTGAGTHSLNVGINNTTSYRCLTVGDNIKFDGTLGYLLGVGYDINLNMSANSAYSLFVGQNINVASTARVAYSDIIGVGHAINDTVQLFYTVISGQGNSINGSGYVQYCGVAGYNNTFNSSGGIAASFAFGRNNSINHSYSLAMGYGVASTASNQANFAFANGYRFMADGTTQWVAISSSGYVTINNIPSSPSSTKLLTDNGSGVISYRDLSTLPFVPTSRTITINGVTFDLSANRTWTISTASPVWKVQGGTTDATSITDHIYHNGRFKIGDSATSSHQFMVQGDGYFTNNLNINYSVAGYRSFDSGSTPRVLAKIATGDIYYYAEGYFKVNSGGDLTISNYPNTRVDAIMPKNYLCTGTSGQVYSRPTSDFGSFAHTWGSSDITLTSSPGASWSSFPFPAGNNYVNIDSIYSVNGAGVIVIPSVIKYHKIEVTFYWETTSGTSGTPTIEIRCQVNGVNVAANPIFQCKPTATGTPIQLSWITPSTGNVVIGARVIAGPSCYIKTRNLIVEDKGFAPG